LRSARRDAFVNFLSSVAAGGIALGVAALVLALAALAGLQDALRSEVLERTPHLEIELPAAADVAAIRARIEGLDGVVRAQEIVRGRGWLRSGGLVQPAEILGYSGDLPSFFPGAVKTLEGLYIGADLATRWGLLVGDQLEVISPLPTLGPLGPQPRVRSLPLVGTFETGRTEEIERLALPIEMARTLTPRGRSSIVVTTQSLETATALVDPVRALIPPRSTLRTWKELNRPLFFALRLEKTVMFVAVSLIILVAALALVADLALLITNKRTEIGMLGAMGAQSHQLRWAFLLLGGMLAGAGALVGGILGGVLAWTLDAQQWVRLPDRVYFLDYLPFHVQSADLLSVLGLTMILAWASCYFVAQRVGHAPPVEALRR
jgi:lipoprotein-releasing system permease protein